MFPLVIATGPLTSAALSADIAALVGGDHLYFYDAVSPIVLAETIDRGKVFRASRWGRSLRGAGRVAGRTWRRRGRSPSEAGPACGVDDGEGDYLNCPMTREEYEAFYAALTTRRIGHRARLREGDLLRGLPAHRGDGAPRHRHAALRSDEAGGPRRSAHAAATPYAVVQLRQDNIAGDHYSLVGFQTQLKWGEQARVLRMIPGLEQAEFVRFGIVHRNTYINGPTVLRPTWQVKSRDDLFFAGQISGVEGYVESAASGLIAGLNAAAVARGEAPRVPPRETAIGALAHYVSHADPRHYQPTNITFGIMPPPETRRRPQPQGRSQGRNQRACAPRARRVDDAVGGLVTTELRAFLDHLGLNRNASAHTVDAYASDIAQFLQFAAHGARGCAPEDLRPAQLDLAAIRAFMADLHRQGHARTLGVAEAVGAARVRALSAARGHHRDRPGVARGVAEARAQGAGAPVGGRDDAAARDARSGRAARPPRSRHPRAVLRVGAAAERAGAARSRGREPERAHRARDGQGAQGTAGAVQHQHQGGAGAPGSRTARRCARPRWPAPARRRRGAAPRRAASRCSSTSAAPG